MNKKIEKKNVEDNQELKKQRNNLKKRKKSKKISHLV